jgi:predicted AAA+ superfamily ATPase
MERILTAHIKKDCDKKITMISGPRQSGKTTLTKHLYPNFSYFNYDNDDDRETLAKKHWRRDVDCILFDELHKMPEWKRWLKGIYDKEGNMPRLIVTGSANLNTFRKVGDSLAGRYFHYRLHPLDLKEATQNWNSDPNLVFNHLIQFGGFPEPFLVGEETFYRRWQKTHLDIILRQDFLDLYSARSIKAIEILLGLLRKHVGGATSFANLATDIQADPKSVKSWLEMLEDIYAIFKVPPYHHNIARALLKEPKYYFYDIGRISDKGAQLENLVACSLLKEIHFIEDVHGHKANLHYLRTKEGHEIDFLITIDDKPCLCIEVKTSDLAVSKHFKHFKTFLNDVECVQLVLNATREYDTEDGIKVRSLIPYLAHFDLKAHMVSRINPTKQESIPEQS